MSSRALRKLQGPNLLEIASDDIEEEDLLVTSQNSGTKKKINAFNVLADSNDDEEDHASSDKEQISKDSQQENLDEKENVNASGNKSSNESRRKGKKKKKRGKKFEEDDLKKDEDDEFLLLNTSNSSISTGQPSSSLTDASMFTKPLLMVEHRNLNAENELCRKFGTKIVKGDRGRSNHRRIHRSTFLVKPRDNWPKVGKSGIQMKLMSSNNGSY
ncbi:uncharacterized protein LOC124435938 [Xenia sp. Carnegie-2017]|uniref:uncharacterized protein LOC124435938 n=1 Tax=Xenia sp. Carnegie-2017 TaxID=2897299 RepID=UPI001F03F191|nr:uncharacterized protein LOC124435938 [Xenia sp. Carnegie-2017]